MRGFQGFPAGRTRFTAVPDMFFTSLLPSVDDLPELKVTLHLFWKLNRKKGYPSCVSLEELLHDGTLLRGLRVPGRNPADVLREGLARARARGTVLAVVDQEESDKAWFFLNTAQGREAVDRIRRGEISLPGVGPLEEPHVEVERPTIFGLYEQNIGLLQPMIAEELREAEQTYPPGWIEEAFRIAVGKNARNWRYIRAILERWAREGKDSGEASSLQGRSWYTKDEYERFIKGEK